MAKVEKLLAKMRESPTNVSYSELYSVCCHYLDIPRQDGGSHAVFKTPWPGEPRVNIQKARNGGTKLYQVKQVILAIDKLMQMEPEEGA